jgi:hypothetical protein
MSSNFRYNVGLNHVPSYQASSRPYFTSSLAVPASGSTPLEVSFDSVTRFVIITNTTPTDEPTRALRFGASAAGVEGTNYGLLRNGQSFEADFKMTKIYLMSDTLAPSTASVIAGLTGIDATHLPDNWSGSLGVG